MEPAPSFPWTALAIALSALFAVIGVLLSNWQSHRTSRRSHTFQVFDQYRRDPHYQNSLKHTKSISASGRFPDPEDSARDFEIEQIDAFLNHYEFIASSILNGDIDEQFMKSLEYTVIISAYTRCADYIQANIRYAKQPGLWVSLEVLCFRWINDRDLTLRNRMSQFFLLKPYLTTEERAKLRLKVSRQPETSEAERHEVANES